MDDKWRCAIYNGTFYEDGPTTTTYMRYSVTLDEWAAVGVTLLLTAALRKPYKRSYVLPAKISQ